MNPLGRPEVSSLGGRQNGDAPKMCEGWTAAHLVVSFHKVIPKWGGRGGASFGNFLTQSRFISLTGFVKDNVNKDVPITFL